MIEWIGSLGKNDFLRVFERSNRKIKGLVLIVRLDCGLMWLERV